MTFAISKTPGILIAGGLTYWSALWLLNRLVLIKYLQELS